MSRPRLHNQSTTTHFSPSFISFSFPVVEILLNRSDKLKKDEVGALILAPTRELAIQIHAVLTLFLGSIELTSLLIVGGKSKVDTFKTFTETGGNVLVSTPGNLFQAFLF